MKLLNLTNFFFIMLFISSCKTINENKPEILNNLEKESSSKEIEDKINMEIKLSCGKGDIKTFLNDGWTIKKESSQEKICSWKSYPATKDCDMEKDKGCKITKPDVIGEEKIYLLER